MKCGNIKSLPKNYKKLLELNLQTNTKLKFKITLTALIIFIVMGLYGNYLRPIKRYFRGNLHQVAYVFLGIILYMILHEFIHSLFMWILGGERARIAFHGPFTFASSAIYFYKWQYMIIALAPFIIWGTVLSVLCHVYVQSDWFWTFYIIQIVNLTGAISDLYLVKKFLLKPRNLLIRDDGVSVIAYAKA